MKVTFLGATRTVTGSNFLVEGAGKKFLVDCGMYQGKATDELKNEEDFVILSVVDTGIGIPEEHKERIFERFYRVDKSHSKEIGGTGLGLSIVKHAARLHGAEIELQSVVDSGTAVTVKFPKK